MNIRVDLYLLISILILFLFKQLNIFLSLYIFVILHEFAHIIIALILKIKIVDISFLPFGVNARFEFENHRIKEILIALAGPLFSLIVAVIFEEYRIQNLFILITNILPIYPLDGGRILKNILMILHGNIKGIKIYDNMLKIFIILLLIGNIILIVFLKNYNCIFFSIFILQMVGDEIKKDKLKVRMNRLLNIEI